MMASNPKSREDLEQDTVNQFGSDRDFAKWERDQASSPPDYSDNDFMSDLNTLTDNTQDEIAQDILPYDQNIPSSRLAHARDKAKSSFGEAYRANQKALGEQEQARGFAKPMRDIGASEHSKTWKNNLETKRSSAQAAANDKQNSFWGRRKNAIVGWGVGILLAGSVSLMSFPPFAAIAQFGAIVNWLQQTTQAVHDVATGARSMRNTIASARVAARAAVSSGVRTYMQTGRVGVTGQIVGERYKDQLATQGVYVNDTAILGLFNGLEIDINKLWGFNLAEVGWRAEEKLSFTRDLIFGEGSGDLPKGTRIEGDRIVLGKMSYSETVKMMANVERAASELDKIRLSSKIKARYTARMLGIYPWYHPIQKLDSALEYKISEWWRERKMKQSQSTPDTRIPSDGGQTDPDTGEPTKASQEGEANRERIMSEADARATKGSTPKVTPRSVTRGVAGGAGFAGLLLVGLCSMLTADQAFAESAVALTTTMSSAFTAQGGIWGDIQASFSANGSGGVDMEMLSVLSKDLYNDRIPDDFETDDEGIITKVNSYTTKSWTDSSAYQATMNGNTVNTDRVPPQVASMYEKNGGWAAQANQFLRKVPLWDQIGAAACSEVGGWIIAGLSFLGGGVLANAIGTVLTTYVFDEQIASILAAIFQIGSGIPLDTNSLDPDQLAEVEYRGGEYLANTYFATEGGTTVTTAEAYQNNLVAQEYLNSQWAARSLANRLFDATDPRSAIAQLINNSGLNPMSDSPSGYLANTAKLISAVPSLLSSGLLGNKSAQVSAATGVAYDTGAPRIQLKPSFLDKITGGDADDCDESDYDWYVNFWGIKVCDGTPKKVITNNVKDLLDSDSDTYRAYAKECLGAEIGTEADGYKVEAYWTDDPDQALLPGFENVGSWQSSDCASKANQENYQRVALYTSDYMSLGGLAWQTLPSEDAESGRLYAELYGVQDAGVAPSVADNPDGQSIDAEGLMQQFGATGGKYGAYSVGDNGCTTLTAWYIDTLTNLTYGKGHGGDVASKLVSTNPDLTLINEPRAGSIFSSRDPTWHAVATCGSIKCGHTGIVVGVNGNTVTILETNTALRNSAPYVKQSTIQWNSSQQVDFVYVGDHLK